MGPNGDTREAIIASMVGKSEVYWRREPLSKSKISQTEKGRNEMIRQRVQLQQKVKCRKQPRTTMGNHQHFGVTGRHTAKQGVAS